MRLMCVIGAIFTASQPVSAFAAPVTYSFSGMLDYTWSDASQSSDWHFNIGQRFSGEFVYDPGAISYTSDYISGPDYTLTFYNSPLVFFAFSIDAPGAGYSYEVPTNGLTNAAWQYVAIGQGVNGWTGASFRIQNYPIGWSANMPSVVVPVNSYVGAMNPHSVELNLGASGAGGSLLLPNTSPDVDFAALQSDLSGAGYYGKFSVRFSDSFSWTVPGQENVQAILIGRVDNIQRVASGVPELSTWGLLLAGLFFVSACLRSGTATRRPNGMHIHPSSL